MTTPNTIPPGYWQDANGNLVPESKVKDIDKLRHQVVTDLCAMARQQRDGLRQFKHGAFGEVAALVATSLAVRRKNRRRKGQRHPGQL